MLGFLPTRAYRPGTPGATTFLSPLSGTFNYGWDSFPKGEVTGYEVEWSGDGSGSWTATDPAHSGTATGYSDTGLDAGTRRHYRVRAVNGADSGEWSGPASATTQRPELTARFEQAPAEHGGPDSTFSVRVVFSEPVTAGYRNLRDEAIRATNGAVRKASRVNGSSAEWEVTVAPSSREAVTVRISGGGDSCGTGDAVCTEDGRRLSNSPSVTVEGPPTVPLTAELDGVPEAARRGVRRRRRRGAQGAPAAVGQQPELGAHGRTGLRRRGDGEAAGRVGGDFGRPRP